MGTSHGASGPQQKRLAAYLEGLAQAAGHADRVIPLKNYCTGLLLPGERKSVEPMAARLAPDNVRRMHQSLHHLVADAPWRDEAVLAEVRAYALTAMRQKGPIQAWIVDDTGFPKKGTHSVGVTRQYCGQVGKQENCRVAVSLSVATNTASLPIAWRLYLPEVWANDRARRREAGVPDEIAFDTKPAIALKQIRAAVAVDIPRAPVLADAAYGTDTKFREGITELELLYVVGIQSYGDRLEAGRRTVAEARLEGDRASAETAAAEPEASTGLGPRTGARAAGVGLEEGDLASGCEARAFLPVRGGTRPACPPGFRAERTVSGRVAADRVAQRRSRTDQVLVVHLARRHETHRPGAAGEAPLDHRARL